MGYSQTNLQIIFTPTKAKTLGLSRPFRQLLVTAVPLIPQTQVHIRQTQVPIRQTQVHIPQAPIHIRRTPSHLVIQMCGRSTGHTLRLEARSSLFVPTQSVVVTPDTC